ncbi:unnamed protein product [Symbiodinium natans]|uniref:Uncharacterized protein n=1 Tax=Symbiodinium natans TaxID=878477 RepID=A0A812JB60_9DINO|nr:unnamed protein product [Symbiodinium natans]
MAGFTRMGGVFTAANVSEGYVACPAPAPYISLLYIPLFGNVAQMADVRNRNFGADGAELSPCSIEAHFAARLKLTSLICAAMQEGYEEELRAYVGFWGVDWLKYGVVRLRIPGPPRGAAHKRAKEAGFQVQVLQGQLREAEAILEGERQELRVAQEAQAVAGADLLQLKEERKAMLVRISQFEEEKSRDMESMLQRHREQWREAADRESEQMRASIEATRSRILKDLERQTQARESARLLKELEDSKAECMRLRGVEQRHAAVITELESLREKLREQDAAECRRSVDEIQAKELRERWTSRECTYLLPGARPVLLPTLLASSAGPSSRTPPGASAAGSASCDASSALASRRDGSCTTMYGKHDKKTRKQRAHTFGSLRKKKVKQVRSGKNKEVQMLQEELRNLSDCLAQKEEDLLNLQFSTADLHNRCDDQGALVVENADAFQKASEELAEKDEALEHALQMQQALFALLSFFVIALSLGHR